MMRGHQTHTLIRGGARSSKTFFLLFMVLQRAARAPGSRHLIARLHHNAVRQAIWEDTLPKVRSVMCPALKWKAYEQDPMILLPNGAEIWLSGLSEKERVEKILGLEYSTIFLNEVSQIKRSTVTLVRTRLAQKVATGNGPDLPLRMFYDLNPTGTSHWSYIEFIRKLDPETGRALRDPSLFAATQLHPRDNAANLSPEFLQALQDLPERQRKRFWDGEYQAEVEGALWTIESIERSRCAPSEVPPLQRIAVGVDPSGAAGDEGERSDEIGIMVAGLGVDGRAYLLADYTLKMAGPDTWGRRVVKAWQDHDADIVIGEVNYGGDMVRFVVATAARAEGVTVPFKKITASRGKVVRSEPVSALHEQDKIRLVGHFPELEEQMLNMSTSGYQGSKSPDRLDAYVWAITELAVKQRPGWAGQQHAVGNIPIFQQ